MILLTPRTQCCEVGIITTLFQSVMKLKHRESYRTCPEAITPNTFWTWGWERLQSSIVCPGGGTSNCSCPHLLTDTCSINNYVCHTALGKVAHTRRQGPLFMGSTRRQMPKKLHLCPLTLPPARQLTWAENASGIDFLLY